MKYFIYTILTILYIGALTLFTVFLYRSPIWLGIYVVIDVLVIVVFLFLKKDYNTTSIQEKFEFYFYFDSYVSLVFPIPFMILRVVHYFEKKKLRNKTIYSSSGELMTKVNQKHQSKFLDKGQQLEQDLESVDYDVWVTKDLKETHIEPFYNHLSCYKTCEKCKYVTYYQVYDKVVIPSTYSDLGEGEIKKECKFCGHISIEKYVISVDVYDDIDGGSSSSGGSGSSGGSSWNGGGSSGGGSLSGY
jgi:uncharacterized protein